MPETGNGYEEERQQHIGIVPLSQQHLHLVHPHRRPVLGVEREREHLE
jgi:hypothetical protein